MIKTILVDDESRLLSSLKMMLEQYAPQLNIVATCTAVEDARTKISELQPDLVFLDIALPGMNAFELLNELGDISFEVIFVTGHNEYSIQAFKYSAVGYLLKPVDEEELVLAVHKAVRAIQENNIKHNLDTLLHNIQPNIKVQDNKLCLTTLTGFQVVPISEVMYCRAEGSYTHFYLQDGQKICVSRSLLEFDNLLDNGGFMRVHKSYLVNLYHVKEYRRGEGGTVIMSNGAEIDVSRRKKEQFMEKIREVFQM